MVFVMYVLKTEYIVIVGGENSKNRGRKKGGKKGKKTKKNKNILPKSSKSDMWGNNKALMN